jgi:hypothetical protein
MAHFPIERILPATPKGADRTGPEQAQGTKVAYVSKLDNRPCGGRHPGYRALSNL